MKVQVSPSQSAGSVHIPPSKSMSHRAIICASLAKGTSTITNVAFSQDIKTTIEGMRLLGAEIETTEDSVQIKGIQNFNQLKQEEVFCCESGSTLRFFIPIFSLCNQKVSFTGEGRLLHRPQKVYEKVFHEQGLSFVQDGEKITIEQSLKPGEYTLKGDVSSQFISGLLFTLPLMERDSTIHIQPPYESRSYVDLTLQMLETFGVHAHYTDENTIFVPGNQTYLSSDYEIEGDFSQLAFFAVLGAIQNGLTITGVSHTSKQGDKEILSILRNFGVTIDEIEKGYAIHPAQLTGTTIDLSNCPDLGPILTVLAMYAQNETHIQNAGRLRIKESDRIAAMEAELKKFGVDISSTENEIFIKGSDKFLCMKPLLGHNDHRIVMALAVAATCSETPCIIDDAQAINKSYPTFFDDLKSVCGKVKEV